MDILKPNKSTKEEIKKILIKHCSQTERELVIWGPKKDKNADCYFLALAGTAPKGYGIYVRSAKNKIKNNSKNFFKEIYLVCPRENVKLF